MNKNKKAVLILSVILNIASWLSVSHADPKVVNIDMFAGELKLMENINVDRVAIGNGKLIKAEILPKFQLLIIAENEGSTTVHLWHKDGTESDYNIRITSKDPETRVRLEKMVKMDVKIVEFRKAALDKLGVDWSKDIDGPGVAVAGDFSSTSAFRGSSANPIFSSLPNNVKPFQTFFGIATEITSRIKYLASNGDATTLAEPTLSCRNGGSAKFLAGGEVPYPVTGNNGQTSVQFKEYGIKLDISPLADSNGVIAATVKTEVSQIDPSVNVLGSPGFLSRKTETEMNVREGETIVMAGLLNRDLSDSVDKVAGLGNIPIIGWLFKSKDYRNSVTELVVFVTPHIVDADTNSNKQQLDRVRNKLEATSKEKNVQLRLGIIE